MQSHTFSPSQPGVQGIRRRAVSRGGRPRRLRRQSLSRPLDVKTHVEWLRSETAYFASTGLKLMNQICRLETRPVTRMKVAVDVDEVLGQFLVALNRFCRERYGIHRNVADYHVYHFATVWGCSQEMSTEIVHEFFESAYFHQLPLVPGAFEALCEMQAWCDLHVVTSRQHVIRDITIEWLMTHYPGIFKSIHFGNHFARDGGISQKKSDLCKGIRADVLIDDNPGYALDCASCGIDVILYNWQRGYPWSHNSETKRHDRIREVTCWSEIPNAVRRMARSGQDQDDSAFAQL